MGKRPVNALKGKQGFQPTGRTDPVQAPGSDTGFMGKVRSLLGIQQPARFIASSSPDAAPAPSYAIQHDAWRKVSPTQPDSVPWLRDDEREALWTRAFHKHTEYGYPRRFDIYEKEHEQIANFVELIKTESHTPRGVGRAGIDDYYYVRNGDIELQVRAARSIAAEVLDEGTAAHSRNEGRGVYAKDTVSLAKKLSEAARGKDARAFTKTVAFERADGQKAHGDVLNDDTIRLVSLVERDQNNSPRLARSREAYLARTEAALRSERESGGRFTL